MAAKPTFKEALAFWTKLGFISFGGPAGHLALMHEYLVEKKKWISESKFLHAVNYCMILPGPEATQLATYMGWLLHGRRGGLIAGLLFILPSTLILLLLSMVYVIWGQLPWVTAIFDGLKPAVIVIVIIALLKIGSKSLLSAFHYLVATAAFVSIYFLHIPFPLIILGAIALAAFCRKFYPSIFKENKIKKEQKLAEEQSFYINQDTKLAHTAFSWKQLFHVIAVFVLAWFLPLLFLFYFSSDFTFWKTLTLFFTQAAFVTFGGAYAVLPYVAQVSVQQLGWLTGLQMMDGLALGETTPGPLIMVLAFVGFMGGFNHFNASLAMGSLSLLLTVYYTFLPCFLFIFAGAPLIERTQENLQVKELLSLVTAAVVGVVLNLTIFLLIQILFQDNFKIQNIHWPHFTWIIISFIALYKFKLNMIYWLGISAIYGLANYFFTHIFYS
jgi:chromate transporter